MPCWLCPHHRARPNNNSQYRRNRTYVCHQECFRLTKIAIIYARFGPYHVARLRGAAAMGADNGWETIGIEVCPDDRVYAWDKVSNHGTSRCIGLLDGCEYSDCTWREIAAAVTAALAKEMPDVVVSPGWAFSESIAAAKWCRRNNKKSILMSESCKWDKKRVWWSEWFKRQRVGLFDAALVGGSPHADYLVELGMPRDRIAYGHNIVDNNYFAIQSEKAKAQKKNLRIALELPEQYMLASGRFVSIKNFKRLLQAYRLYRSQSGERSIALVICGDGMVRKELQELAKDIGISSFVYWPGFIQYDRLPDYYALADFFIAPSTVEPWGLVVNEAMTCGLPVIVSKRCGCAYDLVEEGVNGFTVDPYSVEDMAAAMLKMSSGEADLKRMGKESERIIAKWTPETFAKGLWWAIETAGGSLKEN